MIFYYSTRPDFIHLKRNMSIKKWGRSRFIWSFHTKEIIFSRNNEAFINMLIEIEDKLSEYI